MSGRSKPLQLASMFCSRNHVGIPQKKHGGCSTWPNARTSFYWKPSTTGEYKCPVLGCALIHNRFHPAIQRVKEIIDSGELGGIKEIQVSLCFPKGIVSQDGNIRLNYDIGGGALMDAGCKS